MRTCNRKKGRFSKPKEKENEKERRERERKKKRRHDMMIKEKVILVIASSDYRKGCSVTVSYLSFVYMTRLYSEL
jgi:hypothetical protein